MQTMALAAFTWGWHPALGLPTTTVGDGAGGAMTGVDALTGVVGGGAGAVAALGSGAGATGSEGGPNRDATAPGWWFGPHVRAAAALAVVMARATPSKARHAPVLMSRLRRSLGGQGSSASSQFSAFAGTS